jgi:glycosyltransferase involved in cell wall biosynthesis
MIVRNEFLTIEQCFDSVAPYIDYWVIVDTGSNDGTQEKIISLMRDKYNIPGELHERPWRDFGFNRTEAITLANGKSDYLLVIDADDTLECQDTKVWEKLTADAYRVRIVLDGVNFFRTQLFKNDWSWRYKGVLHEYLQAPHGATEATLEGAVMHARVSSDKRDAIKGVDKYLNDAKIFQKAIEETPMEKDEDLHRRYWFYLAQSLRDGEDYEGALNAYTERALLGGWDQEVWFSLYMCARLKWSLERSVEEIQAAYLLAWENRPHRLEPIYYFIRWLMENDRILFAYTLCQMAIQTTGTKDVLFVENAIWEWKLPFTWSLLQFKMGRIRDAKKTMETLLDLPIFWKLAEEDQKGIKGNYEIMKRAVKDLETKKDSHYKKKVK